MSLAKFRRVFGKNGSGRFVVSEGAAPSAYLLPHEGLPTLYTDLEDQRFEVVMPKGCILSLVADSNGDSRLVPANGDQNTDHTYNDGSATPVSVTVPHLSVPIGCAQYDLYRPFDKGTSQGGGWITEGYVEWPLVQGLNDTIAVGSRIRADQLGRPVPMAANDSYYTQIAKVIEIEKFATNFDDGLLSYMLLPSDPGALKLVYELSQAGPYQGKLGIRANLDQAFLGAAANSNVIGAFRAVLTD